MGEVQPEIERRDHRAPARVRRNRTLREFGAGIQRSFEFGRSDRTRSF